jgi:hypothetical protein
MAEIELVEVLDAGDDVLLARGRRGEEELEARGWVSATTNHYPPDAYDEAGALRDDAKPRAMSADEVGAYALALLREQHPEPPAAAEPTPIAFTAPEPG